MQTLTSGMPGGIYESTRLFVSGTGGDPFGAGTISRPWDDASESIENAKRRLGVAFEFFKRLGNDYYTFHDR